MGIASGEGEIASSVTSIIGGGLVLLAYYYALVSKSNIRRVLENIFSIPELIGKLVFTLSLLAIYRIGFHIPLPGLNAGAIQELAARQQSGIFGQAMEYFSMFTGGSLQQSTLFGLGIMPYISASIIFTLLVNVIPSLEKLKKEGPAGQKKIQEYTRYAAVGLCVVQAIFWMKYMMNPSSGLVYPEYAEGTRAILIFLVGVVGLTAGTIFLMWLGEQIDEYGIGNGISLLIMAGIVVRLPHAIALLASKAQFSLASGGGGIGLEKIIFLAASFVFVVAGAILITQGQRRIPIQQAKQTRGRRVYGGQRHYMPLRVNHGGVMPIIFASSLMIFPGVLFKWLAEKFGDSSTFLGSTLLNMSQAFENGAFVYTVIYIGMIFFFAYFWTTVNFRPKDMADQLRDMGHFIPGLRPGKRTSDYLERVMERITYCGAAFLAVIAVIPTVIATKMEIPFAISAFIGGTGLLIMVSVTLDLVQRIESNLVMRNYGGFLGDNTRIKGAY
ncbi:MAG: preprotein translocase subunit SecY [Phycisphaerae bacterium]|nr:preprotein translocase subunit SecY [Phycisphaerae bacterium]